jgi:hypothetical protein
MNLLCCLTTLLLVLLFSKLQVCRWSILLMLIVQCNVAYALSVAEEIEGAEPSNYS